MVDDKGMNRYDSPSALYYKIVFYFTDDNGLLGVYNLSEDIDNDISNIKKMTAAFKREVRDSQEKETSAKKVNYRNTAYNYLLVNDEVERAEMLKQFIILLSDINSSAPWYFQEIAGLDGALERKIFSESEVKLEDKPRQITIKCLKDAYDNRIGTLLDLYRASCFSYQNKKEIVPSNLRKFNMGILVFNAPIRGKSGKSGDKHNMIFIPDSNPNGSHGSFITNYYYVPSAKLIELRNCEFDYNSAKSAWGTLNTTDDAFSPEYTITINYDDAYESRYNEIMEGIVTDFINIDILSGMNEYKVGRNNDYVWDNDYKGNTIIGNEYEDKNLLNPKTIDYNKKTADLYPMKITFKPDILNPKPIDEKGYWLNSDISSINSNPSEIYEGELDFGQVRSDEFGTAFGENILTSQLNNLKDKASNFIQLPSISKNDNIHDYGTVNKLGEFEYLNRLSGMGGFVGNVMQQAVGTASSAIKDKVSQVYLGNIHSLSVSNMLDMSKKFLSGDIAGGIASVRKYNNPQIGDTSMIGSTLPEYNGKDNQQQRKLGFLPTTKEIHDGGEIGRALNKGAVLDVDVINHTIGSEKELSEVIFTTENISENTGKISIPKKIQKRINDPEGSPVSEFVTTEIWTDPIQRTIDPSGGEIWTDPIQRDLGFEPITNEIWTDPFQRNIDSDSIGELPGYIKRRTKFLNEMNKKQSIRNNI
jgi:hypothetical protein